VRLAAGFLTAPPAREEASSSESSIHPGQRWNATAACSSWRERVGQRCSRPSLRLRRLTSSSATADLRSEKPIHVGVEYKWINGASPIRFQGSAAYYAQLSCAFGDSTHVVFGEADPPCPCDMSRGGTRPRLARRGEGALAHRRIDLKLPRVISLVHRDNIPSRRVAEKIGMTVEKQITFRGFPTTMFSLSRHRWLAPSGV
jgi:hypothetical protein